MANLGSTFDTCSRRTLKGYFLAELALAPRTSGGSLGDKLWIPGMDYAAWELCQHYKVEAACWASIPPGQGMHDIVRTTAKMMGSLGGGRKIGIRHGDCFASHRMAGALEAC